MKRINSFSGTRIVAMSVALFAFGLGQVNAQTDCNLSATAVLTHPSCDAANGAIVVTPVNGPAPYTYFWSTGSTTNSISGVIAGGYWCDIWDATGCRYKFETELVCEGGEDCQLRTQTQGGWGQNANSNGNNPGQYLHANFATCFPNGVMIGCSSNRTLRLTTAAHVSAFLPSGTSPRALNASYVNPGQTYRNVLAGQLMAATISVGFDRCSSTFGQSSVALGDASIAYGTFAGWTVDQLLLEANNFIGGCGSSFSKGDLNTALTLLNENFVDGTTNNGFIDCVKKENSNPKSLTGTVMDRVSVYPNPSSDMVTLDLKAASDGQATINVMDMTGRTVIAEKRTLEAGQRVNTNINVSNLGVGTYMIMMQLNGRTTTERFSVVR